MTCLRLLALPRTGDLARGHPSRSLIARELLLLRHGWERVRVLAAARRRTHSLIDLEHLLHLLGLLCAQLSDVLQELLELQLVVLEGLLHHGHAVLEGVVLGYQMDYLLAYRVGALDHLVYGLGGEVAGRASRELLLLLKLLLYSVILGLKDLYVVLDRYLLVLQLFDLI